MSRSTEIKQDVYRGKDCLKMFCEYLREYEMKVDNFKKRKTEILTKEQKKSNENAKTSYVFNQIFEI